MIKYPDLVGPKKQMPFYIKLIDLAKKEHRMPS